MKGFKITCNDCGNAIDAQDGKTSDYKKDNYFFYTIQSSAVNIGCSKCDNEIFIDDFK